MSHVFSLMHVCVKLRSCCTERCGSVWLRSAVHGMEIHHTFSELKVIITAVGIRGNMIYIAVLELISGLPLHAFKYVIFLQVD